MAELKKDETKRMLGRQPHTCKICGAQGDFETYLAREMMQDTRDEFAYFVCGVCSCLQIVRIPENLGDYYGSEYYFMRLAENEAMEFAAPAIHWQKVLDVGCGSGGWLVQKAMDGWGNLYGCDPFLDHDRHYGDRVYIRSCSIHEMEGDGSFDVIRMHDSFEHMTDPLEVLRSARRLLKPDGLLTMTIPVYPNIAFEKYGPHWYQLDAPRHIFLHSKKSLEWLAKKAGLSISGRKYQSNNSQFIRSFFYQNGIPFYEQQGLVKEYFSEKELTELALEAERANEREYGDYMAVNLTVGELPEEESGRRVIFQRFSSEKSRYAYPYPPVCREPDTDYICFTTEADVKSGHWKIQRVENLEKETLEPYLEKYSVRRELAQDQIQMGSLFGNKKEESLVKVLPMEELPYIRLDLSRFEPTADEQGQFLWQANPVYQKGKYNGRPLLLTIGVPVSNQIETIDRCLSHIRPLLEGLDAELVVIDTGSTDGTVEVCKSYGARVYEHPWHDNMSAARNEAIRHARGLWYMSIDDDEWFEDVEDILHFFKSGEYKKYTFASYVQRNYIDSEGTEINDMHALRMAQVTPELHFEGRIHDALVVKGKGKQLFSYAHHYGFVNDRPDRLRAKFQRNAAILLQDVYEYPEDLRFLFQLANEYKVIQSNDTALRLFAQCVSLSLHLGEAYREGGSVMGLAGCLYALEDERLFAWENSLNKAARLCTTDQCLYEFLMTGLAFAKGRSAREVLSYYDRYEELLKEYGKDPSPAKRMSYYGLPAVESGHYISDARAVGFCMCLRLGEEGRALEILGQLSLEEAKEKRVSVFEEGFAAGAAVFEALCGKLSASQWEEWADTVLNAFTAGMTRYTTAEQQKTRFPEILSRLSVSAVQGWLDSFEHGEREKVRERLIEYALEAEKAGRFVDGETPLSELALCARVLKKAYVKNRVPRQTVQGSERKAVSNPEPEEQEKNSQLLNAYIMAEGAFAERYYAPEHLLNPESGDIPPETQAAYRMAIALFDGVANSENVALLKQALEIFPPFHQEIRSILTGLQ